MKSTNTEKISSVTLKGTWFDIFSNCEVSVKIHLKVIFQVNPQLAFLFQRLKNSNLSKTTTNKYVILSNIEKWKNFGVILTMNYSVTISRIIRHVPEVVRSPKVFFCKFKNTLNLNSNDLQYSKQPYFWPKWWCRSVYKSWHEKVKISNICHS